MFVGVVISVANGYELNLSKITSKSSQTGSTNAPYIHSVVGSSREEVGRQTMNILRAQTANGYTARAFIGELGAELVTPQPVFEEVKIKEV